MLRVKRAYEPASPADGYRVLVDRLWPRGVKKEALRLDRWAKELAPSTALRQWYGHDPAKWAEFKKRYAKELATPEAKAALDELRALAKVKAVTLLFSSKEEKLNNAAALAELLR